MSEDSHFTGKTPVRHVAEKLAEGKLSAAEVHGAELPGYLSAGTDAARETAVVLLLLSAIMVSAPIPPHHWTLLLLIFSLGLVIWKFGRSAWLGGSRIERLHRVVKQEKWEIEHNREQEKYELKELYAAKGFEGKLLEQVVDVLMADGDRLLKVMVEEELGLKLESYEHPLKQACGAGIGAIIAVCTILLCQWINPHYGVMIGAFTIIAGASTLSANYEENRVIPAVIWTTGLAILAYTWVYFLYDFFFKG